MTIIRKLTRGIIPVFKTKDVSIDQLYQWIRLTIYDQTDIRRGSLLIHSIPQMSEFDALQTGVVGFGFGLHAKHIAAFRRHWSHDWLMTIVLGQPAGDDCANSPIIGEHEYRHITSEDIRTALSKFVGEIEQSNPSAPVNELAHSSVQSRQRSYKLFDDNINNNNDNDDDDDDDDIENTSKVANSWQRQGVIADRCRQQSKSNQINSAKPIRTLNDDDDDDVDADADEDHWVVGNHANDQNNNNHCDKKDTILATQNHDKRRRQGNQPPTIRINRCYSIELLRAMKEDDIDRTTTINLRVRCDARFSCSAFVHDLGRKLDCRAAIIGLHLQQVGPLLATRALASHELHVPQIVDAIERFTPECDRYLAELRAQFPETRYPYRFI